MGVHSVKHPHRESGCDHDCETCDSVAFPPYRIDGQSHTHYHSADGYRERLNAVGVCFQYERACWPPCRRECCKELREYIKGRGDRYTGVPGETWEP